MYWEDDLENPYDLPECNLSDVVNNIQNPEQWLDFSVSLEGANSDAGYLFESFELVVEYQRDQELKLFTEAIVGDGFSLKDEDGNISTPGAVISGALISGFESNFTAVANTTGWNDVLVPLIQGATEGLLRRGINEASQAASRF